MKNYYSTIVLALTSSFIFGQDYIFTQFMQLPVQLNPALSGSDCGIRMASFYQNISNNVLNNSSYQTFGISVDAPIAIGDQLKMGVSYQFSKDMAGEVKYGSTNHAIGASIFKTFKIGIALHTLSFGGDGGLVKISLDEKNLRWPSQITPNGFNPNLPSEFASSARYLNMNTGIAWNILTKNEDKIRAGITIYHINQPNISFFSSTNQLKMRLALFTNIIYNLSKSWSLIPSIFYSKQGQFDTYNIGIGGKFAFNNKNWLQVNTGFVKKDEPFLGIILGINKITFGANYNFKNDAELKKGELILTYLFKSDSCKSTK